MTEPMVDLMVPTLRELSARRSEKWALYEPDVLSLTIAEMDFPIFAPIRDALVATIGRGDLGYVVPTPGTLSAALTRFAQRRLNWRIDPEQVTVIPDVMLGLVELCRMLAAPGEAVGSATPAYPPFFPSCRRRVCVVSRSHCDQTGPSISMLSMPRSLTACGRLFWPTPTTRPAGFFRAQSLKRSPSAARRTRRSRLLHRAIGP